MASSIKAISIIHTDKLRWWYQRNYCRKGAVRVGFVRPSVRHVQRISGESEGLACPNSDWGSPTFDSTRIQVLRSKGQRSMSPGPLTLTHIVRYIFRTARPILTSNVVYRWRTTTRITHRRHDLQGRRSRSQNLGPMLYLCHLRLAGAYRVCRTRRPHFLYLWTSLFTTNSRRNKRRKNRNSNEQIIYTSLFTVKMVVQFY